MTAPGANKLSPPSPRAEEDGKPADDSNNSIGAEKAVSEQLSDNEHDSNGPQPGSDLVNAPDNTSIPEDGDFAEMGALFNK